MLVGFIPVVDWRFLLMCSILLCEYTTITHSTVEHLGYFSLRKLEAIMNAVAMIIPVYNFRWTHVTFLLDIKRSGIRDNKVCKCLVYMDVSKNIPQWLTFSFLFNAPSVLPIVPMLLPSPHPLPSSTFHISELQACLWTHTQTLHNIKYSESVIWKKIFFWKPASMTLVTD